MTSTPENDAAFQKVCDLLANHMKGTDSAQQTLNRLFKKHLTRKPTIAKNAPTLSSKNVTVTELTAKKLSFVGLALKLETGPAYDSSGPIIVARFRGVDCLLDGSHRCRHWYRTEDLGDHTAYVLLVNE